MIGFPKNSTDILNLIKSRQEKGYLSSGKDLTSFFKEQTDRYLLEESSLKNQEGWRYFPVQRLMQTDYLFSEDCLENKEVVENRNLLPESFKISLKNGNPSFSKPPEGVNIFLWKDFLKDSSSVDSKIKDKIYQSLKGERNSFCSLNNILSLNGFILLIDKPLKDSIEIQYFQNLSERNRGLNLRVFVFVKEDCSAQILETFYGSESKKDSSFFFNLQTDCILEKKSRLNYLRLDQGNSKTVQINQLFISMDKESKGSFLTLNLNSGLSRYSVHTYQKEKSTAEIKGLSLLGENKHSSHEVVANHLQESSSHQFYQSLLFDSAKHIFNGIINIKKEAQKTTAYQLNKNLLFGKKAFAVSCPELDIRADDVTAIHGATISSLEEKKEMLFYLQSRGLSLEQSSHFLLSGIIRKVLSFMDEKTLIHFESLIWYHLKTLQKNQDMDLQ